MTLVYEGHIEGDFNGWQGETIFQTTNGATWQQARYRYKYFYKYRPQIKIFREGSRYTALVDGDSQMMEIQPIH